MINYDFDKNYVTCVIKIPINHTFNMGDLYTRLNYLKYYEFPIRPYVQLFNYNEYNVIINHDVILMENVYKMSIDTIDNILIIINDLWRVLQFSGFITKYEIITKSCSRKCNICNKTIYNENETIVPLYDILKILYNNNNSLFHYIPMDVINVICDL